MTLLNLDMAKDSKNKIKKEEQKIKENMFNIYNGQKIKNPIISTSLQLIKDQKKWTGTLTSNSEKKI